MISSQIHVLEANATAGNIAERSLSGTYPRESCSAWPVSCAATAAAATDAGA